MDEDEDFCCVFSLTIKYTVVAKRRSPVDGVAGLDGLIVQAHCLSRYSYCSPPQPPAQYQRGILWLTSENRTWNYYWRDIPTGTVRSLVWCMLIVMMFRVCLRHYKHVYLRVDPMKDAADSPLGKADRLYLYLHVQKLYVERGSTNTNWHINVHYVKVFLHTQKV